MSSARNCGGGGGFGPYCSVSDWKRRRGMREVKEEDRREGCCT